VFNGFTPEHHHKSFATVRIDIGNSVSKSLDQLSTTFLHGKTSFEFLFVISVFLFFYADVASKKSLFLFSSPSQTFNNLKNHWLV